MVSTAAAAQSAAAAAASTQQQLLVAPTVQSLPSPQTVLANQVLPQVARVSLQQANFNPLSTTGLLTPYMIG